MKRILIIFLAVLFATIFLPLAVVYLTGRVETPLKPRPYGDEGEVNVYITDEERTEPMSVRDYLCGVVAAEMPADFELEALKAQAVAARTYLYSRLEQNEFAESHHGAAVCTDYTHCQAYISKENRFKSWGADAEQNWDKITRAVDETSGQIMTYDGQIISALFHSTSSGVTEAAADVWGNDVPYLQSVRSESDINSPKYLSSATFTEQEFADIAAENVDGFDPSAGLWGEIERSDAGGIISLTLGGVKVRGTDFRTMYNLRSTNAELLQKDGNVIITVRGYGHGVGMSQYGANYMAMDGMEYEEILKSYYTGIEVGQR